MPKTIRTQEECKAIYLKVEEMRANGMAPRLIQQELNLTKGQISQICFRVRNPDYNRVNRIDDKDTRAKLSKSRKVERQLERVERGESLDISNGSGWSEGRLTEPWVVYRARKQREREAARKAAQRAQEQAE